MKSQKLTVAEILAGSQICLAVKSKFIGQMLRYEALAEKADSLKKEHYLKLAARAKKRAISYLQQGMRISGGSDQAYDAYVKAVEHHVKLLRPPKPKRRHSPKAPNPV